MLPDLNCELVRDTYRACYSPERLAELYDRPHTLVEVLTRKCGAWSDVPDKDRVWTACYHLAHNDMPTFRRFLGVIVRRALGWVENPDPRSLAVLEFLDRGEEVPKSVERVAGAAGASWAAMAAMAESAAGVAGAAMAAMAARAAGAAWAAWAEEAKNKEYAAQVADLLKLLEGGKP